MSPHGGIGIRSRLKICISKENKGSSPFEGILNSLTGVESENM